MKTSKRHTLKLDCGITLTGWMDQDEFHIEWSRKPRRDPKEFERIKKQYVPWRDGILAEFARETGQRVMVVTA